MRNPFKEWWNKRRAQFRHEGRFLARPGAAASVMETLQVFVSAILGVVVAERLKDTGYGFYVALVGVLFVVTFYKWFYASEDARHKDSQD